LRFFSLKKLLKLGFLKPFSTVLVWSSQ